MRIEIQTGCFPRLTAWHLRQALKWISPLDLSGVESIRLLNDKDVSPKVKRKPFYLRDVLAAGYEAQSSKGKPKGAHINFYPCHFYTGFPSLIRLTPAATMKVAFVLAHEIGHHLVVRQGYIYEPTERYKAYGLYDEREELMASRYAHDLMKRMSRVWYYRLGRWLAGFLSNMFFDIGLIAYKKGELQRAAYYWFCSYSLNSDHKYAAVSYATAVSELRKGATWR